MHEAGRRSARLLLNKSGLTANDDFLAFISENGLSSEEQYNAALLAIALTESKVTKREESGGTVEEDNGKVARLTAANTLARADEAQTKMKKCDASMLDFATILGETDILEMEIRAFETLAKQTLESLKNDNRFDFKNGVPNLMRLRGDGSCLPGAVLQNYMWNILELKTRATVKDTKKLRNEMVEVLKADVDGSYAKLFNDTKGSKEPDLLYSDFCDRMLRPDAYCEETCIQALCDMYRMKVMVFKVHHESDGDQSTRIRIDTFEETNKYWPQKPVDKNTIGVVLVLCIYRCNEPHYYAVANCT